jgi:hypothetical protein
MNRTLPLLYLAALYLVATPACLDGDDGGASNVTETGYLACTLDGAACTDGATCTTGEGAECVALPDDCVGVATCACAGDATCGAAGCTDSESGFICGEANDGDGDGVPDRGDCAPDDASVSPFSAETCDGLDNDCDGVVDEGCDSETPGDPAETDVCGNAIDDDGDGLVDEDC